MVLVGSGSVSAWEQKKRVKNSAEVWSLAEVWSFTVLMYHYIPMFLYCSFVYPLSHFLSFGVS